MPSNLEPEDAGFVISSEPVEASFGGISIGQVFIDPLHEHGIAFVGKNISKMPEIFKTLSKRVLTSFKGDTVTGINMSSMEYCMRLAAMYLIEAEREEVIKRLYPNALTLSLKDFEYWLALMYSSMVYIVLPPSMPMTRAEVAMGLESVIEYIKNSGTRS